VAITVTVSLTAVVIAAALSLVRQRLDAAEEALREWRASTRSRGC
jgi:hypothetical protein